MSVNEKESPFMFANLIIKLSEYQYGQYYQSININNTVVKRHDPNNQWKNQVRLLGVGSAVKFFSSLSSV